MVPVTWPVSAWAHITSAAASKQRMQASILPAPENALKTLRLLLI
jgi:hypothetical protein